MPNVPSITPLGQVVNFTTLFQAVIFVAILSLRPFSKAFPNQLLAASLLLMATTKADQLYQTLGGFSAYPQFGFILAPLQGLLTPCLYLYVLARTIPISR